MPFPRWVSIISAVLGSAVVSLGMVLQKKGVGWFERKTGPERIKESRRDRTAWLLGYGLNNSLVVFYFFALKALEPSIVGAMMGLNIVFTALFSRTILKEPLSKRVIAGSAVLIACIAVAIIGFMQVAYANAWMTSVAPALWGAQIAYPGLIAYTAFSVSLVPVQLAAFAGVVACVVLIQSKR